MSPSEFFSPLRSPLSSFHLLQTLAFPQSISAPDMQHRPLSSGQTSVGRCHNHNRGMSLYSFPALGRYPNRRSRSTAWTSQRQLRRCSNSLATTVYERSSGSADYRTHPTIPSLPHLPPDPALLGEDADHIPTGPTAWFIASLACHILQGSSRA